MLDPFHLDEIRKSGSLASVEAFRDMMTSCRKGKGLESRFSGVVFLLQTGWFRACHVAQNHHCSSDVYHPLDGVLDLPGHPNSIGTNHREDYSKRLIAAHNLLAFSRFFVLLLLFHIVILS